MGLSALVPGPRQFGRGEVPEVFLIAGTRPEAVKMAPVAAAMFAGLMNSACSEFENARSAPPVPAMRGVSISS